MIALHPITRQKLWLCLPAVMMCALDAGLTLVGQRQGYWAGDRTVINESNPVGYVLLAWHPLAFVGGILVWMAIFCGVALALPKRLAASVVLLAMSHAGGASIWLLYFDWPRPVGMLVAAVFLLTADVLIGWSWRRFRGERRQITAEKVLS
jgi:hypothetical protein